MTALEKIKEFADKAHGEQRRKYTPERYIVHPVRVMELCREYTNEEPILAAALLHDVLEDTSTTAGQIKEFLIPLIGKDNAIRTLDLVVELTDVYIKKDYPIYNRRKRKQMERERMKTISSDSQTIKYADILDNCLEIVIHDPSFAVVFLKECKDLLKVMTNGNNALYQRVLKSIDNNLKLLDFRKAD